MTSVGTAVEAQLLGIWGPRPEKAAADAPLVPDAPLAADAPVARDASRAPGTLVTVETGPACGAAGCGGGVAWVNCSESLVLLEAGAAPGEAARPAGPADGPWDAVELA